MKRHLRCTYGSIYKGSVLLKRFHPCWLPTCRGAGTNVETASCGNQGPVRGMDHLQHRFVRATRQRLIAPDEFLDDILIRVECDEDGIGSPLEVSADAAS